MTHSSNRRRALALFLAGLGALVTQPSLAQQSQGATQSQGTRIAGQIAQIDGDKLGIKSDDGKTLTVLLAPNAAVTNVVAAKLSDIKPGLFVGATAVPEAGDRFRTSEVHIFANGTRPGEGHYPWNTGPNATMTNADVTASAVKAGNGTMTLATGGQNYNFDVPPSTAIVAMKPGAHRLIKKGARVSIFRAEPAGDGSYKAAAITVISAHNWPPK